MIKKICYAIVIMLCLSLPVSASQNSGAGQDEPQNVGVLAQLNKLFEFLLNEKVKYSLEIDQSKAGDDLEYQKAHYTFSGEFDLKNKLLAPAGSFRLFKNGFAFLQPRIFLGDGNQDKEEKAIFAVRVDGTRIFIAVHKDVHVDSLASFSEEDLEGVNKHEVKLIVTADGFSFEFVSPSRRGQHFTFTKTDHGYAMTGLLGKYWLKGKIGKTLNASSLDQQRFLVLQKLFATGQSTDSCRWWRFGAIQRKVFSADKAASEIVGGITEDDDILGGFEVTFTYRNQSYHGMVGQRDAESTDFTFVGAESSKALKVSLRENTSATGRRIVIMRIEQDGVEQYLYVPL